MDALFDQLGPLPSKRRNTYKRISRPQEEEETQQIPSSQPPLLLGDGFLFQNSTIDKVRNRLKTLESNETEKNIVQEESTRPNPTQVIADLYEGAQELEKKKDRKIRLTYLKGKSAVSQEKTQVIASTPAIGVGENNIQFVRAQEKNQGMPQNDKAQQPFLCTRMNRATQRTSNPERNLEVSASDDTETQLNGEENHFPVPRNFGTTGLNMYEGPLFQPTVSDIPKPPSGLKMCEIEKDLQRKNKDEVRNAENEVSEGNSKKDFSKEAFLKYFDEESDAEDDVSGLETRDGKSDKGKGILENTNKDRDSQGLLGVYEHKLRGELDSKMRIQLEDDEESDIHMDVPLSRDSKATVLEIKARISKKKSLSKVKQARTSLNDLICSLKKASKKQISDRQREIVERRGYKLEDIEKEKQEIESLLEQEIARNKKLAIREKEANRSADSEHGSNSSINESKSPYFSNIEFSESDFDEHDDDENPHQAMQGLQKKEQAAKETDVLVEENVSEEENEGSIRRGRIRNHKLLLAEDADCESDADIPKNAIDLGPYGNNLHSSRTPGLTVDSQQIGMDIEKEDANKLIKKIQQMEMKKKKKEQKERRLREMEARGISKMLEMEAEESDDEWKGIGGVDGDILDEHDSELEEMIDDFTKSNDDLNDKRQLLAKEDKETDEKMVNKILHDIKNGGFYKRNRDVMNLELTDEGDEDLYNYQLEKRGLVRKRRLQYRDQEKSLKNFKSKAFLDSMVDDIEESKYPFGDPEMDIGNTIGVNAQRTSNKDRSSLSEEFVQRSLSFLTNSSVFQESEFEENSIGNEGHDLSSLKKNSSIKSLTSLPIHEELVEEEKQDEDFICLPNFRPPQFIKSIASGVESPNKFEATQKVVTISKSFRAVGGNRSSITYFSKMRKLAGLKKNNGASLKGVRPLVTSTTSKLLNSEQSSFEK